MEKKFTDEEVIEVLKNCGAGIHSSNRECRYCVLEDDGRCVNNLRKYSLDLIHRLQEENAGLLKENEELTISYHGVQKQAAKRIVELTTQVDKLTNEKAEQEAEIERLTAAINQRREMMSRMDCNYATELQKNAELQKQVDELKAENAILNKQVDRKDKAIVREMNIGYENERQAVKDTAEKVFNEVMSCIGSLQMFWIVDGKARTLVDAEKLFEESCKIAKNHGICLDEEETKDKAKTMQWSKYEVE